MLTIAFDQATVTTGYSIYRDKELIKFGHFNFDGEITDRISHTVEKIEEIIGEYMFQYNKEDYRIVIEDIQLQRNPKTFKQLAQLQGAVINSCYNKFKKKPEVYLASSWKSWNGITGGNRSQQKKNAQKKVRELYKVKATQDEADSILLGLYAASRKITWE